jgi:phytanoyl-CoA hydroxylase
MGSMDEALQEQFQQDGYLIFDGLLPAEIREKYLAIFGELVTQSHAMTTSQDGFELAPDENKQPRPGVLHKVQGVCVVDNRVLGLAAEPLITTRVAALINEKLDVFGTKFFPMQVKGARSTGWHQDNHYFGTNSHRVISCAIYLEDTNTENGCLRVLPGSHKTGELVAHESGEGIDAHGQWAQVDENRAVDVVCSAGTVVLFSANLLHGARFNNSDKTSYRTAWHYLPQDLDLEQFPYGIYKDRHRLGN